MWGKQLGEKKTHKKHEPQLQQTIHRSATRAYQKRWEAQRQQPCRFCPHHLARQNPSKSNREQAPIRWNSPPQAAASAKALSSFQDAEQPCETATSASGSALSVTVEAGPGARPQAPTPKPSSEWLERDRTGHGGRDVPLTKPRRCRRQPGETGRGDLGAACAPAPHRVSWKRREGGQGGRLEPVSSAWEPGAVATLPPWETPAL